MKLLVILLLTVGNGTKITDLYHFLHPPFGVIRTVGWYLKGGAGHTVVHCLITKLIIASCKMLA